MKPKFTRRAALGSAVAVPVAGLIAATSNAAAPMMDAGYAPFMRIKLGEFDVTTLLVGSFPVSDPQTIFGTNVRAEEFGAVSVANNLPTDQAQFFFTPTLVNTGTELILFDTGLSSEGTTSALTAAGYTPDQIDVVAITHMHRDHIGGLMAQGAPTFPNARYITGATEFDAWSTTGNENFEAQVRPLADQMAFLEGGDQIAGGITALAAFGHTPGHMAYIIESGGKQLVLGADFANHYVWSLAYPDWEVKFDMDKAAAAKSRRMLLDMMATDKVPFVGYHMPWPAIGFVETRDSGFRYVPHSYQLML